MASSNYNTYNYHSYRQTSTPHYSAYQTVTVPSSPAQTPRQQASTVATTQALPYQAPSYGSQANIYGSRQDRSWTASNYEANRGNTRGAAEVLHNMSNAAYTPNMMVAAAAAREAGFTSTHGTSVSAERYSNASPAEHAPSTHSTHTTYKQTQARPSSINANRAETSSSNGGIPSLSPTTTAPYPSQRAQNSYSQEQQRSASLAQPQYNHSTTAPTTSVRNSDMSTAAQYNNYSHRQPPSADTSHGQSAVMPNSYNYANNPVTTTVSQATASTTAGDQYNQSTITVDPMQVYDPWPEYQRKQEKLLQRKAFEDTIRAEEERKAEEALKEEKREGERKAEGVQKEKKRNEEERERLQEEERTRQSKSAQSKKFHKQSTVTEVGSAGAAQDAPAESNALEAEIRAMMVKMRELNSKDPVLLARIWEEERRAKVSKSPIVQNKAIPRPVATPAQMNAPLAANQHEKAAPKKVVKGSTSVRTPFQAPAAAPIPTPKPQTQAVATRPSGQVIWPPEKKAQLAHAATTYLNAQNPNNIIPAEQFLSMLNGNPSYIDLCEQLEAIGYKLDRSAFAKNLLTVMPDVNSTSKSQAQAPPPPAAPPAAIISKKGVATHVAAIPQYTPKAQPSLIGSSYPPLQKNAVSVSNAPVLVAEAVQIKPELKPPANKEEAARKRNFSDLIDLTMMDDEDDIEPMPKKHNIGSAFASPSPSFDNAMDMDQSHAPVNNFPSPGMPVQPAQQAHIPSPKLPEEPKFMNVVQPLDKKKALRRNAYNIKTIARDVLLACGRHPEERQLNAHLDVLKTTLSSQVSHDSDLSTLRWDLLDPGNPPRGYYRDRSHTLIEDADDEDESENEGIVQPRAHPLAIGVVGGADTRVQALPATNPFKIKRRGRPPGSRRSYPDNSLQQDPRKQPAADMDTNAPRPTSTAVGYSAFRSATEYGPDGQPLPKKKGRPIGWRKSIHGSAAAQAQPAANNHTGSSSARDRFVPYQPSTLRNVRTGDEEHTMISSRSPSLPQHAPQYQSFKCKWQNCQAELHNLETLNKHVHKVHHKETPRGTLECLWDDCGREVTNVDSVIGMRLEQHSPFVFSDEAKWREHLEVKHFSPLSWKLGDGPASGLSDAYDSEAYLSDANGRRVTPRITAEPSPFRGSGSVPRSGSAVANSSPAPRGRGRPPKAAQEQEARDTQRRLVNQKKRVGGPGMDRGGSTFVNDKRRKGFSDDDQTEEEFVDAEG